MALPVADAHIVLVEYAEAFTALIRRTARHSTNAAHASIMPLEYYAALMARQLHSEQYQAAWQTLQQIGYHLDRAARADDLSRTQQVLLTQWHVTMLETIAVLLNRYDAPSPTYSSHVHQEVSP